MWVMGKQRVEKGISHAGQLSEQCCNLRQEIQEERLLR